MRAQLEQASVALRSIEAVTDPALAVLPLDELLDAVLARTKEAVGGDVVAVLLLDAQGDEGSVLRVRAVHGASELAPLGSELPIGQGIVGSAAMSASPVVASDVAAMSESPTAESIAGLASVMAAPLVVQGTMLGMVEVGSTTPRSFGSNELRLLQVVADRCAGSIERARLDEIARRNRLGAEHANLHLRILALCGTVLGKALESYDDAFNELADVVVPDFADWFSADRLDATGAIQRIASRGRARGVPVGTASQGVRHPHPQGERLIRLAIAERRPQVFMRTTRLGEAELGARVHTPASLGGWPADVASMMIVPVRVEGAFWGALSFVTGPGRRGYRPSDLFTAREFAERVGVAVERVISWRASHRAGEEAVHYAQRLQRLVEAALVVNAQLAEDELLELLVEHARRVLDAEVAVVVGRRVAGWSLEKYWPDISRPGGQPMTPGRAQTSRTAPSPGVAGESGRAPEVKRIVLTAADVVARLGSVVRRPDDWPGAMLAAEALERERGHADGRDGVEGPLPGTSQLPATAVASGSWGTGSLTVGLVPVGPTRHPAPSRSRGWLGAPIFGTSGECNRVVVAVAEPGAHFSAEDESVLTLLAQMASVALQNASLYADVRTNERRLEAVVVSSPLAIAELLPSGEARWWNPAAAQLFGWQEGGQLPRLPVRPGSELILAGLLEAARAGKPTLGVAMPAVRPGGGHVDLSVSVSPLGQLPPPPQAGASGGRLRPEHGAVTGLLLVAEDVTERTRMIEQVNQAERLNAMTRMAGAVAHDFNNLLTVILGCSDVIARRLHDDDQLGRDVEAIQRAGTRAAALTGQLVRIGQHRPVQPEVVDIDEVLRSMAPMLAGVLGEDVDFELVARAGPGAADSMPDADGSDGRADRLDDERAAADVAPGDTEGAAGAAIPDSEDRASGARRKRRARRARRGRILVDRSELERSILNLAINARDAMPDGGKVTVRTANVPARQPGGLKTVQLVFTDTGTGMDADTAAHCFEPFFTTKGRARGTGLGLSTVHATVTQAAGEVTVDTAPGKGARFTLSFPAHDAREADAPVAALPDGGVATPATSGGETLLVVDDEPEVLRLEVRELQASGYEVFGAANASEALHLLNARGGAVDLLVTDVVMPGMNGIDLANAVRRRYTHVGVLFVSGHLDDAAALQGPLPQEATLLTKPFRPEELSSRVREALDRALEATTSRRPRVETP